MKIKLLLAMAIAILSVPAMAPVDSAAMDLGLKGCLKKVQDISFSETLIHCAQLGTPFQNMRELNGRGWELKLISSNVVKTTIPLS